MTSSVGTRVRLLLLLGSAALAGCAAGRHEAAAPGRGDAAASIYVVAHGWHTGITLPRAAVPAQHWPEAAHFGRSAYIEVGWGDRDFYMARGFNAWFGFKALFWPTASVLHVAGLPRAPPLEFAGRDVVELAVTRQGLQALADYISASFERGGGQAAAPLGPGDYAASAFYPSHEKFHLFNTCNAWSARALRAAGIPLTAGAAISAQDLMAQARRFSRR